MERHGVLFYSTGTRENLVYYPNVLYPPVAEGRLFIALCPDPSTRHLDGSTMGGQLKLKEQKRSSKIIDIISYALKMGTNGCRTCVCSLFQSQNISTGCVCVS